MTNCQATIIRGTDQLQAGQRVSEQEHLLLSTPAYLASPARTWERVAAIEGRYVGILHLHTAIDLRGATRAEIANHPYAGSYHVINARGNAHQWALALERRP